MLIHISPMEYEKCLYQSHYKWYGYQKNYDSYEDVIATISKLLKNNDTCLS